eukprot:Clim_evm3s231 gene=Clim_evmTU3s231
MPEFSTTTPPEWEEHVKGRIFSHNFTVQPMGSWGGNAHARSTFIVLSTGKLLVYTPGPCTDDIVKECNKLGTVSYIITPNRFHHLYVCDWLKKYPEAQAWVAQGLKTKRADLFDTCSAQVHEVKKQEDLDTAPFAKECNLQYVTGSKLREIVVMDKASKTLLVADSFFHNHPDMSSGLVNGYLWLFGAFGENTWPWHFRALLPGDKELLKACWDSILAWQPENTVPAHGRATYGDATAHLKEGFYKYMFES